MQRSYARKQKALWTAGQIGTTQYGPNDDTNIPKAQRNAQINIQSRYGFRILPVGGYAQFPVLVDVTFSDQSIVRMVVESSRWVSIPKPMQGLTILPNEIGRLVTGSQPNVGALAVANVLVPMWNKLQTAAILATPGILGDYELHVAELPSEVVTSAVEKVKRQLCIAENLKCSSTEVTPGSQSAPQWYGQPLVDDALLPDGLIFVPADATSLVLTFKNNTGADRVVSKIWVDNLILHNTGGSGYTRADQDTIAVVTGTSEIEVDLVYTKGAPQLLQLLADTGDGTNLRFNAFATLEL